MKKEYIVKTHGKILNVKNRSYEIVAKDKAEAVNLAKERFNEEYTIIDNLETQVSSVTFQTYVSLVFLTIAVLLTAIRWVDGHNVVSLRPSISSCLYAIAIYSGYFVRFKGIKYLINSWTDLLFCPLLILLLSSFVQALFSVSSLHFLGLVIPIDAKTLLLLTCFLSWLGLKFISLICAFVLFFIAASNLVGLDAAMGSLFGPIYIICSFIGLVAFASTESAFQEGLFNFGKSIVNATYSFKDDIIDAKSIIVSNGSEMIDKINNFRNGGN